MPPTRANRLTATVLALVLAAALAACEGDIEPGTYAMPGDADAPAATARARRVEVPSHYEAVGTVRPKTETKVEAQVTGRVEAVGVRPGDAVKRGQKLVELDERQSENRVDQAEQALAQARSSRSQAAQAVNAAKAAYDKAESTYKRMRTLHEQKVITQEELEQAESAYLQAEAELNRSRSGLARAQAGVNEAERMVDEARIGLDYTTITAPADGEVTGRSVDPGDLAFPGKTLLTLRTGGALRLEAMVREGMMGRVHVGDELAVVVPALPETVAAPVDVVVEEIEPSADAATRTFLVKAALPALPGLYPGMFGRLLVPLDAREAVTVPEAAIRRVGQMETVRMRFEDDDDGAGGGWRTVFITTGARLGDDVEVLSGLDGGETVALEATP